MQKKLTLLVLVIFLVGLVSGCSKAADPLDAYKQAGIKATEAKTSRQIATVSTAVAGANMNIVTDMVVDLGKNLAAGKCVIEMPGLGGGLEFDAYMVDGRMYMQAPGLDKYIAYPADFGDLYKNIDPNQIAELMSSQSKPAIENAAFTVNGVQVTGKKVTLVIDTAKMKAVQVAKSEAASEETKQFMADSLAAFDSMATTIPLTGYIDADGYLARVELDLTVTQSGTEMTVKTVAEMFDFGKPVDIQTPVFTAENTITFQELTQGLQSIPR